MSQPDTQPSTITQGSNSPNRWSLLLASIIAGAVSGLVARLIAELTLLVFMFMAAIGLIPLYRYMPDDAVYIVLLLTSALGGALISSFVASGTRNLMLTFLPPHGRQWRFAFVVCSLFVWPSVALWGYLHFDDVLFIADAHPLPSLLLWPLSGAVVASLLSLILVRKPMITESS